MPEHITQDEMLEYLSTSFRKEKDSRVKLQYADRIAKMSGWYRAPSPGDDIEETIQGDPEEKAREALARIKENDLGDAEP